MIIAVDFDGTLCEDIYPDIVKSTPFVINLFNKILNTIYIFV